jgi:DNA-binding MarR family transcriptional regulator
MLASLERLGLVVRRREMTPSYGDRRQRWVELTARGAGCLREARTLLMRALRRIVDEAICFGRHWDRVRRFYSTMDLEAYLDALRQHLGDTATLYYPWGHPDD